MGIEFTLGLSGLPTPEDLAESTLDEVRAWADRFIAGASGEELRNGVDAMAQANQLLAETMGLEVPGAEEEDLLSGVPVAAELALSPLDEVLAWAEKFAGSARNGRQLGPAIAAMQRANRIVAEAYELEASPEGLEDAPPYGLLSDEEMPSPMALALSRQDEVEEWATGFVGRARKPEELTVGIRGMASANRIIVEECERQVPEDGLDI